MKAQERIYGWRGELLAGVRAELPLLLGVVPFGLVYGVIGLQAGLPAWAVIAMSSVVFGGASQVVFAQLWGGQVPVVMIGATVGVVNLRHTLYSASVAQMLHELPLRWRLLLAYLLTDEAYAAAFDRLAHGPATPLRHWFLLGTGVTLWAGWQLSTLVGVLAGATLPRHWGLDFSIPLTFIALLMPQLRRHSGLAAALTAGITALSCQWLPYKLWIIVAAAAGMTAGCLVHRMAGRGVRHD